MNKLLFNSLFLLLTFNFYAQTNDSELSDEYKEGAFQGAEETNGHNPMVDKITPNDVGKTVIIEHLEIMTRDIGKLNWEDAKIACTNLGKGWRLPTMNDLKLLYLNRAKIGNFAEGKCYWSSDNLYEKAYFRYFNNLYLNAMDTEKTWELYVRPVRTFVKN